MPTINADPYAILRTDLASVFPEMVPTEMMDAVVARARAQRREVNDQEFFACFGLSANPSADDRKRILAGVRAYFEVADKQKTALEALVHEYQELCRKNETLRSLKAEVDAATKQSAERDVREYLTKLDTDAERDAALEFYRVHGATAFRAHMSARGIHLY